MAIIYDDYINSCCALDLGRYVTLNWNVFLLAEDDKFILFLKNEKLGLANKHELKSLTLSKSVKNNYNEQFSECYDSNDSHCLVQIFLNKYCKIQTAGTLLDMDGVIKAVLVSANFDSIKIEHKNKNAIINTDRIVYLLET